VHFVTDETVTLRALASPARQRILDLLGRAPATSAMVARSLGSNTGVVSYHLRQLGKAGLIERDPQRSRGREVYWRLCAKDVRFNDPSRSEQPALAETAIDLIMSRLVASVRAYTRRSDLDPHWREAALFSRSFLHLDAAELARFQQEYLELVRRWSKRHRDGHRDGQRDGHRDKADARPIRLAMFAFPDDDFPDDDDEKVQSE
jgi:DNA-binding transcriptional ArsR family regulator